MLWQTRGGSLQRPDLDVHARRGSRRALTAFAAVCVLYILSTRIAPDSPVGQLVANLLSAAAPLWAAWMSARRRGPRRAAWLLLAAFCASWGVGQLVWTFYELGGREVPFPSLADLGFLGAVPFGIAAALSLSPLREGLGRLRRMLDGLIVSLSLLFCLWVLLIEQLLQSGTPLEVTIGLAYPLADAAIITAALLALPGVPLRDRRGTGLVLVGLVAFASADAGFAYLAVTGGYFTGHPIDLGWLAGFMIIGFGARTVPAEDDGQRLRTVSSGGLTALAPYVALLPAVAAATYVLVSEGQLDRGSGALGLAVALALIVRQVVTTLESEGHAARLRHQAIHDPLTGLANRDAVRHAAAESLAEGEQAAVLFIDVDDFKDVNDSLGHSAGDELLRWVAERLQHSVRAHDLVARMGGDEFAVLLRHPVTAADAIHVAERILQEMAGRLVVDGAEVGAGLSIGIALATDSSETAETLLRNGDLAMYAAKRAGKGRYQVYEAEMHAGVIERLRIRRELERALENQELELHYQPEYDLRSGQLVGAEGLLRWRHPERGLLAPGQFLDIATESGLIGRIGQQVIEMGITFGSDLHHKGLLSPDFMLALNLAAEQLRSPDLARDIRASLHRLGLPPQTLILELTESSLIDTATAPAALAALREAGVRIAIDDFGTGYSSLSYLQRFPVDILKIDRSFVDGVDRGVEAQAMAKAIVVLGHSMGLQVVAEGVERAEQASTLAAFGCDFAQGFLYARPLPGDRLAVLLADQREVLAAE